MLNLYINWNISQPAPTYWYLYGTIIDDYCVVLQPVDGIIFSLNGTSLSSMLLDSFIPLGSKATLTFGDPDVMKEFFYCCSDGC